LTSRGFLFGRELGRDPIRARFEQTEMGEGGQERPGEPFRVRD